MDKKLIVSTKGYGWERLGVNLLSLDCGITVVKDADKALSTINTKTVSGLVVPSLALLGIYENEELIENLINVASQKVARIVVVSMLADQFKRWEDLSSKTSLVRVRDESSDGFFLNVARFLAGDIDEI